VDDLTNFKQPSEKDWRDNIYTGKNMPTENAQRELRDKERYRGEKRFTLAGMFLILAPLLILALLIFGVWSLLR